MPVTPTTKPDSGPKPHSASLYTTVDSPIGELLLRGDGRVLTGLFMQDGRTRIAIGREWCRAEQPFEDVESQIGQYFDGDRTRFDLPLSLSRNAVPTGGLGSLARSRTGRRGATAKSRPRSATRLPQEPSARPTAAIRSPSSFPAIVSLAPMAA